MNGNDVSVFVNIVNKESVMLYDPGPWSAETSSFFHLLSAVSELL